MPINIVDTGIAAQQAGERSAVLNNAIKDVKDSPELDPQKKIVTTEDMAEKMLEKGGNTQGSGMEVLRSLIKKAAANNLVLDVLDSRQDMQDEISDILEDKSAGKTAKDMVSISSRHNTSRQIKLAQMIMQNIGLKGDASTLRTIEPLLAEYVQLVSDTLIKKQDRTKTPEARLTAAADEGKEKSVSDTLLDRAAASASRASRQDGKKGQAWAEGDATKEDSDVLERLESRLLDKGLSKEQVRQVRQQALASVARTMMGKVSDPRSISGTLSELGMTGEQIKDITQNAAKEARAKLVSEVKDSIIARELSQGKLETMMTEHRAYSAIDDYVASRVRDLGDGDDFMQTKIDIISQAKAQAKEELAKFSISELENSFIGKLAKGGTGANDKITMQLVNIAQKTGDLDKWMEKGWLPLKKDLGFEEDYIPQNEEFVSSDGQGQSGQEGQEQKDPEEELLKSRLIAEYVSGLLQTGLKAKIETSFKVMGYEKGLRKLGVTTEVIGKLKEDARYIAAKKAKEVIFEGMLEMSSLVTDKQNTSYQLAERKVKNMVDAMKKMGIEVTDKDLESAKMNAASRMRTVVEMQIKVFESGQGGRRSPVIDKEVKRLGHVLKSLNKELGIESPDVQERKEALIA